MLIGGLICLALAGLCVYLFLNQRKTLRATQVAETFKCGELSEFSKATTEQVGEGTFEKVCEVVGAATPAESGPLTAPESKQPCVWHKTVLTEHYWDWERDSDGDRRRVERTRQLSSPTSETTFYVDDGTGRVAIDPRNAEIDGEEKVFDRMERDMNTGAQISDIVGSIFQVGDSTIGIEHEEWVLRPGKQLYVLGQVTDRAGNLELRKPSENPMVISTRTEQEFAASTRKWAIAALAGAVVLGLAGVGLIVGSFFA
jgi:hypothetical protein